MLINCQVIYYFDVFGNFFAIFLLINLILVSDLICSIFWINLSLYYLGVEESIKVLFLFHLVVLRFINLIFNAQILEFNLFCKYKWFLHLSVFYLLGLVIINYNFCISLFLKIFWFLIWISMKGLFFWIKNFSFNLLIKSSNYYLLSFFLLKY